MKKLVLFAVVVAAVSMLWVRPVSAQDAAPDGAAPRAGEVYATDAAKPAPSMSLFSVIFTSGALGIILWIALFASAGGAVYFAVDCGITVRTKRIMPQTLIDNVNAAMGEGDVLKALQFCENEPGPMANILTAGFSHVEEGFDIIQEAITTAADLETEKLMQKLTWISVMASLAPMLGLLGTVQGMIGAFANIGTGVPDVGILAVNIAQALYTTAAGLAVAIPAVTLYNTFRNAANKIVLRMEAMTMELIKDLRNVEVVEE